MTSHHFSTKCCFQNDDLVRLLFLSLIPFRFHRVCFCRFRVKVMFAVENTSIKVLFGSSTLPSISSVHISPDLHHHPPSPTFAVRLQCESCHRSDVPLRYRTTQHSSQGSNSALLILTYCTLRGEMRWEMRGDGRGTSWCRLIQNSECIC